MANSKSKQERKQFWVRLICGVVCVVMLFSVVASIFFI